jgi:hypothetical protein
MRCDFSHSGLLVHDFYSILHALRFTVETVLNVGLEVYVFRLNSKRRSITELLSLHIIDLKCFAFVQLANHLLIVESIGHI